MRMTSAKKKTFPQQLAAGNPKAEDIVITINDTSSDNAISKRKEDAGKPLYLKRI
jgi:hypothetical protein